MEEEIANDTENIDVDYADKLYMYSHEHMDSDVLWITEEIVK